MGSETLGDVIRRLGRLSGLHGDLAQTDAQLLDRFARRRDEAAFAALVARHGPMVHGVCRRLLHDSQEAEDAFQASFLVLARKAGGVRRQALLGGWLYGVAYKVAARLRGRAARRRERLQPGVDLESLPADPVACRDLETVVHEEVERLPDKYRSAVVLCHLEGKSNEEAAVLLRRPVGTIKSRLTRARELLRTRLARRGMALSGGALTAVLVARPATAPAALLDATLHAAARFAAGETAAGGLASARVVALTQGVLRTMMLTKLKIAAALALTVALFGGAGGLAYHSWAAVPAEAPKGAARAEKPPAADQPKDDATKDKPKDDADAQKIQGTWAAVSAKMDGKAAPAEVSKDLSISVTADTVAFNRAGENRQSTYKLDPTKTPKVIELTPQDGPRKGKTIHCLYELDGDRLKLCLLDGPGEEPKEFATTPGSNLRLLILKRMSADDKAGSPGDDPKPAPAEVPAPPAGAQSEKEQKLLKEWCETAKKAFEACKQEFVAGKIVPQPVIRTARGLLTAEAQRAATKADRVAAYEAYLDRITEVVKVARIKLEAGKIAISDVEEAECIRLEAEFLLGREKAK